MVGVATEGILVGGDVVDLHGDDPVRPRRLQKAGPRSAS